MAKARFFYALRPDPEAADALAALAARVAARWGGHAFAADDIHLTLAFVGMRALDEQPALAAILQGLAPRVAPAPPLALSRLGSFGHGVLWLAPPPQARNDATFAHALAHEIRRRLGAARIDFDARPLKLHATLVRGARNFGADEATTGTDDGLLAPEPIVAREWSLALGAGLPNPSDGRRYRWWTPAGPPVTA